MRQIKQGKQKDEYEDKQHEDKQEVKMYEARTARQKDQFYTTSERVNE